jgi:glycosyltransferase involved in cell wall biosynthesis
MAGPIHVGFLIDRLGRAGTEMQLVGLIRRLDRARVRPYLVLLDGRDESSRAFEPENCPVARLGVTRLRSVAALGQALRFARFLRRERIEVLQVCSPDSALFGVPVGRWAGVPRIVLGRRSLGYWMTPVRRVSERMLRALADVTLTNAESIRREVLADGARAGSVVVLENGIDLTVFESIPSLSSREGARKVGVVANLRPVKDLPTFVRAAEIVARSYPDVMFPIAGEGEERPALEQLIAERRLEGRVVLEGAIGDVPSFLAGLRVAVLCSRSEGQSNALIEAMAAGRAVVATAVGDSVALIEHERNGLLVEPGEPSKLASAIERLLREPDFAARLGAEARERVCRRHDWPSVARRYEAFYEGLVGRSHGTV